MRVPMKDGGADPRAGQPGGHAMGLLTLDILASPDLSLSYPVAYLGAFSYTNDIFWRKLEQILSFFEIW